jgi:hypothetical protein
MYFASKAIILNWAGQITKIELAALRIVAGFASKTEGFSIHAPCPSYQTKNFNTK